MDMALVTGDNCNCNSLPQNMSRRALGKIVKDTLDVCSRTGDGGSVVHFLNGLDTHISFLLFS